MEEVGSCGADCSGRRFCDQSAIVLMNGVIDIKGAELIGSVEE